MIEKTKKRGDIPITILVLGVVAICLLAIMSFYTSSQKVKSNFDTGTINEAKLISEKAALYENLGWSQGEIDSILDIKSDDKGRYILLDRGDILVRYYLPR